jgi:hypothetical protein
MAHYNAGSAIMESFRVYFFKIGIKPFAKLLGVERHIYMKYVSGESKTRDYIVARMLHKLDEAMTAERNNDGKK